MDSVTEENEEWDVIENGIVGGFRMGSCMHVNPTQKYHADYCDGRMSMALMVAMMVLGFVTIFVNLGVIIRTVKILRRGHEKPAFFFIGNLALSDLAVGMYVVIAFLLHVTNKSDLWRMNTCMVQIGVAVTACQETIFTIVLISVDKYLYICHGLHYSSIVTRKRVYGAILASWCLALLVGSLPAIGLHVTWAEACNRCVFVQVISTTFAIVFFVTSVAVPLAVVVALYSILLVLALKMHKARYGGSYTANEAARSSNFRLSFMRSKTSKSSVSTTTSCVSSSSSKASRRRTKRKAQEEYKTEFAKRDSSSGGGNSSSSGGGGVRAPEGIKLIQEANNDVPKGVVSTPVVSEDVDDVPKVNEEVMEGRDTPGQPGGGAESDEVDLKTQIESNAANDCKKGTKNDTKTGEVLSDLVESRVTVTSEEEEEKEEEEVATEDQTDNGQSKRSLFPFRYMNTIMTETRDKVLFLKKCRAVKTVLLILVSFSATYVPFVVGTLVYSAEKEKRPCLLHLLNTLFYCAVVANSLVNPLIYAYGYREFRLRSEKFKGIFAREKPRPYT